MRAPKACSRQRHGAAPHALHSAKRNVVQDAMSVSQQSWLRLQQPFLLPVGCCRRNGVHEQGVQCVDWQTIEYGVMGCKRCGNMHVCRYGHCVSTETENLHVCNLTGAVLRTITFRDDEFLETMVNTAGASNSGHVIDKVTGQIVGRVVGKGAGAITGYAVGHAAGHAAGAVGAGAGSAGAGAAANQETGTLSQRGAAKRIPSEYESLTLHSCIDVCEKVLCSKMTNDSMEKEKKKIQHRVRWSFTRHVRNFKATMPPGAIMNMIVLISRISVDTDVYRLVPTEGRAQLQQRFARRCAVDITRFIATLAQAQTLFSSAMDCKSLVIGLLYLLRVGVVYKTVTILPRYRELVYLLPPENLLYMFNIKSKIITESENFVKSYLRTISDAGVRNIGYERLDSVISNLR